ncbi:MAG: Zn-ribbon domain-containing OB-fold protein [Chloroflexota bacterium]
MAPETAVYGKPLPHIDPDAQPYWTSLKEHQMRVQQCQACQRFFFPPSDYCPRCLSGELEWQPVIGHGSVYAAITMHHVYRPAYKEGVPYNISLVDLDEGARLWTNVVGCPPSEVRCGMRVELVYEDVTPEITLAKFRPSV